jgi:LysR family transcriptional regulator, benzoate and cis,cis-muconate-responsive activator of ben and cat genes
MDLRQLRYFVAVARERNFTRAAQILNMAQPPLSRQIQLLEEQLGVPLIIRKSRPVRLTEAGRLFYEQSQQILGRVEQMQAATRRVGLNQNSVLSIGFVASTLYAGLPSLVRKLREHAPELDIQLLELVSVQQIPALKEGRIDIGFGRVRNSDPNVVATTLREERLVVAIPKGTPLSKETSAMPVAALDGCKIIVYPKEPRPGFADHVLGLLQSHDLRLEEIQEVREIQTALGLVAAEAGVCVIPASARQMRSDVHYRLLEGKGATSPIIFSHRIGDSSQYIDLVKQLIEEIYAENPSWMGHDLNPLDRGVGNVAPLDPALPSDGKDP